MPPETLPDVSLTDAFNARAAWCYCQPAADQTACKNLPLKACTKVDSDGCVAFVGLNNSKPAPGTCDPGVPLASTPCARCVD